MTHREVKTLKRLKVLRQMHDGDTVKCKSLDDQIKHLSLSK